ncbi:MAG: hypothetical protein KDA25_05220 [Phycisphaerales bacterium]|nr:hypothetical protein [Phycisphaerales bacterium]
MLAELDVQMLIDATKTLGMPVVVAVILIVYFIQFNKHLTAHNSKLADELAELRSQLAQMNQERVHAGELLTQNESLQAIVKSQIRENWVLVHLLAGTKPPLIHESDEAAKAAEGALR